MINHYKWYVVRENNDRSLASTVTDEGQMRAYDEPNICNTEVENSVKKYRWSYFKLLRSLNKK